MPKDTCRKESCKQWLISGETCPNYFENTFYPAGKIDEACKIADCAPIRTMLLIKEQNSILVSIQGMFETNRNLANTFRPLLSFLQRTYEKSRTSKQESIANGS